MKKLLFLMLTVISFTVICATPAKCEELIKQGLHAGKLGRFAEAEKLLQTSLKLRQVKFGKNSIEVALCLRELADLALYREHYTLAEKYILEALKIEKVKCGSDSIQVARSNVVYAEVLLYKGKYKDMISLLEAAVAVIKSKTGESSEAASKANLALSGMYTVLGLYDADRPVIEKNYKLQLAKSTDSEQSVLWKIKKAQLAARDNKMKEALLLSEHARAGAKKLYGKKSLFMLGALKTRMYILKTAGQREKAKKVLAEINDMINRFWGAGSFHSTYGLYALVYLKGGEAKYQEAMKIVSDIEKICVKKLGSKHLFTYSAISRKGMLYLRLYQPDKAAPLICSYRDFIKKEMPENGIVNARSLYSMGILYREEKKHDQAEKIIKQALKIFEKQLGKYSSWVAVCYNELALQSFKRKQWNEAIYYGLKMKNTHVEFNGKDHLYTAQAWINLGYYYRISKQFQQALIAYNEAMRILKHRLGGENARVARIYAEISNIYLWTREREKAKEACLKALAICDKLKSPVPAEAATVYYMCSDYYSYLRQFQRAKELLSKAMIIREKSCGQKDQFVRILKTKMEKLEKRMK